jgi:phosphate transport system substrate-binding protein
MNVKHLTTLAVAGILAASVLPAAATDITGAGSTFVYPVLAKWADTYKKQTDVGLNYQSIGSGGGIKQITAKTVTFGATDKPLTPEEIAKNNFVQFPVINGAVVPILNLPGIKPGEVTLDGPTIAKIFLGDITKWNDPAIAKLNASVKLPDTAIAVVHRSDGSGTTFIWTDYLSKVSPEWKTKVGANKAPNWPVGLGGKGNEGVAGQIENTTNSLGYIELTYALQNKIQFGKVKNAAGEFLMADLAGVTAAAASVKDMPEDFRVSITNASGKGAYPICTFTWLLVPEKFKDAGKKKAMTDFLKWMLTEGQTQTASLSYASLPKAVVAKETKQIAKIQ